MMHKIGFLVKEYIVLSTFRLDWFKVRPFRGESAFQKHPNNNDCWVHVFYVCIDLSKRSIVNVLVYLFTYVFVC